MRTRKKYTDNVVEDGFSYEKEGWSEKKYKLYFQDLPKQLLERMLKHFRARKEFETCRLILDIIREKQFKLS